MAMKEKLESIREAAEHDLRDAGDRQALESLRIRYLGKKGELTSILKKMGELSAEERPAIGKLANEIRARIEAELAARAAELQDAEQKKRMEKEKIDVTMPGKRHGLGHKHPLSIELDEIKEIFIGLGFDIVSGPEVEYDYYNFEALNIPKDHPSRDTQDTFYLTDNLLLRTQTSSAQIRTMEYRKPPIRIICPGRVYRADEVDATHSPVFHQMEGLVVDKGITMCHLKGVLEQFAHEIYGSETKVRFRPSFFPFTEPSVEVDVSCGECGGKGCRVCKQSGWIEILGAGMIDPNVLTESHIDPELWTGWAFGIGIERVAMLLYGIADIRLFFESDRRFLTNFTL